MAEHTNPIEGLSFDQRTAVETKLRITRAISDVLMCGGAANCAPDTIHTLGEALYYQLGEVAAALGFDPELQGGQS